MIRPIMLLLLFIQLKKMKRIVLLLAIFYCSFSLFAQETTDTDKAKAKPVKEEKERSFGTTVDLYTDLWMDVPEGIDLRFLQQGMNLGGMFSNRFGKSAFSIAIGPVIGVHNLYSDGLFQQDTSGSTVMTAMPGEDANGDGISYKRNKLTLAYLDFPLEFRMKTKSGVLASLAFKAGFLINSHTKYKGDDFADASQELRIKIGDIANVESYRYGVQARLGYKNVSLYGFYSLSTVFNEGEGPAIYPVSVGISLRPF